MKTKKKMKRTLSTTSHTRCHSHTWQLFGSGSFGEVLHFSYAPFFFTGDNSMSSLAFPLSAAASSITGGGGSQLQSLEEAETSEMKYLV